MTQNKPHKQPSQTLPPPQQPPPPPACGITWQKPPLIAVAEVGRLATKPPRSWGRMDCTPATTGNRRWLLQPLYPAAHTQD